MAVDNSSRLVSFEVLGMEDSSCWRLARVVSTMFASPSYQRQGAIWTRRRKQVFIDSLLNGFDVPKLYLHEGGEERDGRRYAIVDGKQRLEALSDFYAGKFALAEDFRLFNQERLQELGISPEEADSLPSARYEEIEKRVPAVAKYLDQRKLDVRIIRTDDIDVIEELFWRLNDAATLNGPEHRRGIGGPGIEAIDEIVGHPFFKCLPFSDRRYRHQDLAAKFLVWSSPERLKRATGSRGAIGDTKRQNLDRFVRVAKGDADGARVDEREAALGDSLRDCKLALDDLAAKFSAADKTLARLGTVAVVYLVALRVRRHVAPQQALPGPDDLREFEAYREAIAGKYADEDSIPAGAVILQDYDVLAQSSNDGSALARRVDILERYMLATAGSLDPIEALASDE